MLMYEIWTKAELPYADMSNQKMWVEVEAGYRLPCPADCPPTVHELMLSCWHADPHERPAFAYLKDRLRIWQALPPKMSATTLKRDDYLELENGDDNSEDYTGYINPQLKKTKKSEVSMVEYALAGSGISLVPCDRPSPQPDSAREASLPYEMPIRNEAAYSLAASSEVVMSRTRTATDEVSGPNPVYPTANLGKPDPSAYTDTPTSSSSSLPTMIKHPSTSSPAPTPSPSPLRKSSAVAPPSPVPTKRLARPVRTFEFEVNDAVDFPFGRPEGAPRSSLAKSSMIL